jgi:predicted transcriptional regulator
MKNGFSILLILVMICFTACLFSVQAKQRITTIEITIGDPVVVIDGQPSPPMKVAPFITSGRTMFSGLRLIAEILGCRFEWKGDEKIIVIQIKKAKVEMQVDNKTAKVNDQDVILDVSPLMKDNQICYPIRFVMESLGAIVTWDPTLHKVTIVYNEPLD